MYYCTLFINYLTKRYPEFPDSFFMSLIGSPNKFSVSHSEFRCQFFVLHWNVVAILGWRFPELRGRLLNFRAVFVRSSRKFDFHTTIRNASPSLCGVRNQRCVEVSDVGICKVFIRDVVNLSLKFNMKKLQVLYFITVYNMLRNHFIYIFTYRKSMAKWMLKRVDPCYRLTYLHSHNKWVLWEN